MLARFILITLFLNYVDVFSQSIYGQNEVNHGESKILGHFIGKSHDSMDFSDLITFILIVNRCKFPISLILLNSFPLLSYNKCNFLETLTNF